jgi:hypothetical protein
MAFFTYHQNNSGGVFDYDYDEGISAVVVVEAHDAMEADYKAQRIGLYFDGVASHRDCGCCGDRWDAKETYWNGDEQGTDVPEVYGEPAALVQGYGWRREEMEWEGFIHFEDGRKVAFAHIEGPGLEVIVEQRVIESGEAA